ncbi:MAG TPA: hypothetical protein PKY49_04465, partial [Anaerolineae bacterium]|nr:hypothetical protein [Anaerolineae bacterium]
GFETCSDVGLSFLTGEKVTPVCPVDVDDHHGLQLVFGAPRDEGESRPVGRPGRVAECRERQAVLKPT